MAYESCRQGSQAAAVSKGHGGCSPTRGREWFGEGGAVASGCVVLGCLMLRLGGGLYVQWAVIMVAKKWKVKMKIQR